MTAREVLDFLGTDLGVVAATALADVVIEPGDPQQLQLGQLADQGRGDREFLLGIGGAELLGDLEQA